MLFLCFIQKTRKALATGLVLSLILATWAGPCQALAGQGAPAPAAAGSQSPAARLQGMAAGQALGPADILLVRSAVERLAGEAGLKSPDELFEKSAGQGVVLSAPGREFVLRLLASLESDRRRAALGPAALSGRISAQELSRLRLAASIQAPEMGQVFDGSFGRRGYSEPPVPADDPSRTQASAPSPAPGVFAPAQAPRPVFFGQKAAYRPAAEERPGLLSRIKSFFGDIRTDKSLLIPAALWTGCLAMYGVTVSGLDTFIHEGAHEAVMGATQSPGQLTVQVDGFENLRGLLQHPSWGSLKDLLTMRDVHSDGAAGYTSYGDPHQTDLGRTLGPSGTRAAISAAGSLAQEASAMGAFAAGYALRKSHPVIGYTLMSAAALEHLNAAFYLWDAALMPASQLASAAASGHDWAGFAQATGINPLVSAVAFSALLPAEALVMHFIGKARERAREDQRALAGLIENGGITEAELLKFYDGYPGKQGLQAAEGGVALMADARGAAALGPGTAATADAAREYRKFQLYVIGKCRERIDAEKRLLPAAPKERRSISQLLSDFMRCLEGPDRDKLNAGLQLTMMGGGFVAGVAGLAKAMGSAAAGELLRTLIPGLGAMGMAVSIRNIIKDFRNPGANRTERFLDVLQNAFGAAGAAGALTLNPILAIAGQAGCMAAMGAKLLYLRSHPASA